MQNDYIRQRLEMIENQLVRRGIKSSRVIDAFKKVPRHKFVKNGYTKSAYNDTPLPIDCGQTISQPYMVALMTQYLDLKGTEKILEIGTGSGYQTAILSVLAEEVFSVETHNDLAKMAEVVLQQEGFENVHIKTGDGTLGWKEFAPYDGIIVTAASPSIPKPLKKQIAENGKMVIPVGARFSQNLKIVSLKDKKYTIEEGCGCVFVPLLGKYGW